MDSALLASAPALGAPLTDWQAWARGLTMAELERLSQAAATVLEGCSDALRWRAWSLSRRLPAPMVQCLVLRSAGVGSEENAASV